MSDDKTKDLFKRAAEIASVVPEAMRAEAFTRALERLEDGASETDVDRRPRTKRTKARQPRRPDPPASAKDNVESLIASIDSTACPDLSDDLKALNQALMVLRLAHEEHGVDGLTPAEIARVLTNKFRISTTAAAIRMALGEQTRLVNRVPRGQAFEYRIMKSGVDYLDLPDDETGSAPTRSAKRTTKKAKKSATTKGKATSRKKKKTGTTKGANRNNLRSGSRPGPKKMLEGLISEKYFDTPRTIGHMITHIQNKKVRTYKGTDLSPALGRLVREGKLDREQDDNGQFKYQSK